MADSSHHKINGLTHDQRRKLLQQLREKTSEGASRDQHSSNEPNEKAQAISNDSLDTLIIGGGVAGMTLALQLKQERPETSIALVERASYPVRESAHKVGESTVEIAAHYLRDVLEMNEHLEQEQIRKFGLRMFFEHEGNTDIADRRELGGSEFPLLATYQLDRGRLENELARRCDQAGVTMITGRVTDLELNSGQDDHSITISGRAAAIRAKWVVDATGRGCVLRRKLRKESIPNGHHANAAWFRIDHPIDINLWTADTVWQERVQAGDRSKSTVHLMGEGYWVWLIRLASGATSVGIVASDEHHEFDGFNRLDKALAWLERREPQCAEVVEKHRDRILDFRVMRDYSYSCDQVFSGTERWAITGEAGIFLDPLYSPGLDQVAISNSLACDLITKSLGGTDVAGTATAYNKLYLTVADIWLGIYKGQYGLLGNASVMTAKVIWDTAFYWAVFGFLFFHGRFLNVGTNQSMINDLEGLTYLSNRVQQLFREWEGIEPRGAAGDFVDLYTPLNFMVDLHHVMAEDCDDIPKRLAENRAVLEQLAGQLVDTIIREHAEDSSDQVIATVQGWQRDPMVSALRRTHRARRNGSPTSDGWIRTSRNTQEKGDLHEAGAA
ncbi:NAD(P)/FAD-dependent oxidoreductase [Naumannella halotolerans]|uniref:Flavin-dependent dehydrogenase n=1 Tax=Naumannella halotolerans TaxID=993414 RepID=A0A4R7IZD0_9ACTN|nr:tryptophan 7-halogenase [Naumannella halotolerans]TDT30090.1 flavin-dependent dehydrogenase [Naumannella halotolerans]